MEIEYRDDSLDRLEVDESFNGGWSADVVRAFRKRMQAIRAAKDERDFYSFASWRFKKLQGDRAHQRSIRLNDQYRLIVEIRNSSPANMVVVVAIEDYH